MKHLEHVCHIIRNGYVESIAGPHPRDRRSSPTTHHGKTAEEVISEHQSQIEALAGHSLTSETLRK